MSIKIGLALIAAVGLIYALSLFSVLSSSSNVESSILKDNPLWYARVSSIVRTYSSLDRCVKEQKEVSCRNMYDHKDGIGLLIVSSEDYVSVSEEKRKHLIHSEAYLACLEPNLGCAKLGQH